jgi:hypothetical protein
MKEDQEINQDEIIDTLLSAEGVKPKTALKKLGITNINNASKHVVGPLLNILRDNIGVMFSSGMMLQEEPFIPEYLGFTETIIESDVADMRVYRKGDFILSKNMFELTEKGTHKWIVKKTTNNTASVHTFNNMLQAVITLESMGCDVAIEDVIGNKYV